MSDAPRIDRFFHAMVAAGARTVVVLRGRSTMAPPLAAGDPVQTPFGKGVVREVRNNGRVLVEVHGRALVLSESEVAALEPPRRSRTSTGRVSRPADRPRQTHAAPVEVDLHGLTVEQALARMEQELNAALLEDNAELRLIHGRSGGRLLAALHRRLQEIGVVRGFRLDPRNAGVTIVTL